MLSTKVLILFLMLILVLLLSNGRIGESGKTELERRIEQTLSSMSGIGEVKVVISTRTAVKPHSASGAYHLQADREIPCGVIAVAEGADDPVLQIKLAQALCALLGLPASAVSIVSGGK